MNPVLFSSKLLKVSFNFFMGEIYLLSSYFYCNELILLIIFDYNNININDGKPFLSRW